MSIRVDPATRVLTGMGAKPQAEAGTGKPKRPVTGAGRSAGDGAWADYLLTAAGLTIVVVVLLLMLARQVAPLGEANNRAVLAAQADGFRACISRVAGSIISAGSQFSFSGDVEEVTISGEDVTLSGGGVQCTYPLALRVYVIPLEINGTVVNDTSELMAVLAAACNATGEIGPSTPDEYWGWLCDELRRNAVRLALSPAVLDPSRPVSVEKVRLSCAVEGEVSTHAMLIVHQ